MTATRRVYTTLVARDTVHSPRTLAAIFQLLKSDTNTLTTALIVGHFPLIVPQSTISGRILESTVITTPTEITGLIRQLVTIPG